MEGLSAVRVAHCCPSFCGRAHRATLALQQLPLLGFQRRISFSLWSWRDAFAPGSRRWKASLEDEAVTEDSLTSPAEEEVSTKLPEEDISTNNAAVDEGPKVNVKFILEKKCRFGQRFKVVGNDPLFGNWDVEAAIPMEWSEGDIWFVEVDVPVEKQVEFKFVLTGERGEIEWQPGANRVFDTVESISPLVVSEAWASADVDLAEKVVGNAEDLAEDATSSDTGGLLVPADVTEGTAAAEAVGKAEDLAEDATSSDTGGLLVPANVTEGTTADDVVKGTADLTEGSAGDGVVKGTAADDVVKAQEIGADVPLSEP